MCPASCGTCPPPVLVADPVFPDFPSSKCIDNKYYSMGGRKRTCHWMGLNDERRRLFCLNDEVQENCPFSCGLCCHDDNQFKFDVDIGGQKKCRWLSKKQVRKNKYCDKVADGMAVNDSCPSACGTCKSRYDEDNCDDDPISSPGKGSKAPPKSSKATKRK